MDSKGHKRKTENNVFFQTTLRFGPPQPDAVPSHHKKRRTTKCETVTSDTEITVVGSLEPVEIIDIVDDECKELPRRPATTKPKPTRRAVIYGKENPNSSAHPPTEEELEFIAKWRETYRKNPSDIRSEESFVNRYLNLLRRKRNTKKEISEKRKEQKESMTPEELAEFRRRKYDNKIKNRELKGPFCCPHDGCDAEYKDKEYLSTHIVREHEPKEVVKQSDLRRINPFKGGQSGCYQHQTHPNSQEVNPEDSDFSQIKTHAAEYCKYSSESHQTACCYVTLIFRAEDINGLTAEDIPTFLHQNRNNKDIEIWIYVGEHKRAGMSHNHTIPNKWSHEHSTIKKCLEQGRRVFKVLEIPCVGNDRVEKAKALEAFILVYLEMRNNRFSHSGLEFKLANSRGEYSEFYKQIKEDDNLFNQVYTLARAESRPFFCLNAECQNSDGHKKEGYKWSAMEHIGEVKEVKMGVVV